MFAAPSNDSGRPVYGSSWTLLCSYPSLSIQYLKGQSPNKRVTAENIYFLQLQTNLVWVLQRQALKFFSRRTSAERFYSGKPMKVLSVAVFSLLFGFIQTAAGLSCRSHCAACWKTGQPGVDIKIGCGFRGRCHGCPPGYESIHCAKEERCQWVDLSMPLFITILFSFILACMFKFFFGLHTVPFRSIRPTRDFPTFSKNLRKSDKSRKN